MKNFKQIELLDFSIGQNEECWILDHSIYSIEELNDGQADTYYSELEAVEYYASENNLIESEQALSDQFDEDMIPILREQWLTYGDTPDHPLISEEFSNWTDALVSDGELHESQLKEYCYIGEYKHD